MSGGARDMIAYLLRGKIRRIEETSCDARHTLDEFTENADKLRGSMNLRRAGC